MNGPPVEVVVVASFPARVVGWDQQAVEVLFHRYHGTQVVIDAEQRVSTVSGVDGVEVGFDSLFDQP